MPVVNPTKSVRKNASVNPNQALWEKGDFTRIAQSMRESGDALVHRLGIAKGLKVLDLGCGDGNTALPIAQLGADVTRRNLNIQPTIKVPVGYRFNVRVNRDMLFDLPYRPVAG